MPLAVNKSKGYDSDYKKNEVRQVPLGQTIIGKSLYCHQIKVNGRSMTRYISDEDGSLKTDDEMDKSGKAGKEK